MFRIEDHHHPAHWMRREGRIVAEWGEGKEVTHQKSCSKTRGETMSGAYDLHTHSILSDGEMLPIELIRRMAVLGYTTVAITDHVDASNASSVIGCLVNVRDSARIYGVKLLCGVEITHVPPSQIADLAKTAKTAGADIVIVHGETPVEPVAARNKPCSVRMQIRECSCTSRTYHY